MWDFGEYVVDVGLGVLFQDVGLCGGWGDGVDGDVVGCGFFVQVFGEGDYVGFGGVVGGGGGIVFFVGDGGDVDDVVVVLCDYVLDYYLVDIEGVVEIDVDYVVLFFG